MLPRRTVLSALFAAPALPLASGVARARDVKLAPTSACADGDEPTVAQTEGPYFTPNAPLRNDLAGDAPGGEPILIGGLVLDRQCVPVPAALLEIWHADEAGQYDNQGFRLRGHGFADEQGVWWFRTIVPGLYPGRTRHYHFKVQRPGGRVLTTQLYFPGEPGNARDGIFDPSLLMAAGDGPEGRLGRFDFVLA
ncbi:MAG: intradiol ring-cleavage dioxygenase [Geminicoccaceae bacterium]